MKISRMDLDMTGSPMGLVGKIFQAEPNIPTPTPIEELARCLDIEEIAELETVGVEGGLLTTEERTSGIILVKKIVDRSKPALRRRRFTIGHELGHFLMASHKPINGEFLCKSEDMRSWDTKDHNHYKRMEAQANEFSALVLIPPPRLRALMKTFRDPDISNITAVGDHFDVSTEAAARSYVTHHDERVAVVFVKEGKILRAYKSNNFPYITTLYGTPVPCTSHFHGIGTDAPEMRECTTATWFDMPKASLYEQVLRQRDGYAMILLWAEIPDEDEQIDEDENRTSSERYRARMSRY